MQALSREELTTSLRLAINRMATMAGPGAHTVWERPGKNPGEVDGFLVYRATMEYQTPVVVWIDGKENSLSLCLVYQKKEGQVVESAQDFSPDGMKKIEKIISSTLS